MKTIIFWFSILLNLLFILFYGWEQISQPSRKLGILKKDTEVGHFMGKKTLFRLPKGITVANESQRGLAAIGQFENKRFSIVITADTELVDYNVSEKQLNGTANYYSADFKKFLSD